MNDIKTKKFKSFRDYIIWKQTNPDIREVNLNYIEGVLTVNYFIGE